MAPRESIQLFENCQGVDYRSSHLTRDAAYYTNLQNMMYGRGYGLHGRPGSQMVGQAGGFTAIANHSYFDKDSGETKQQLLAINDHLWRLERFALTITRTSGGAWGWSVTPGPTNYVFTITQVGVTALAQNLGKGTEYPTTVNGNSGPYTVKQLQVAIDALANFSCTISGNGGELSSSQSGNPFSLVTGHTYTVNEWLTYYEVNSTYPHAYLMARRITSAAANSITIEDIGRTSATVQWYFPSYTGVWAVPAATIPVHTTIGEPLTTTGTVYFHAWIPVFRPLPVNHKSVTEWELFHRYAKSFTSRKLIPATFCNASQCSYIGTESNASEAIFGVTTKMVPDWQDFPYKYDGQNVYRSGVPPMVRPMVFSANTATGITGTFKYTARYVTQDNRGITNAGNDSDTMNIEALVTAANEKVNFSIWNLPYCVNTTDIGAKVDGTQTSTTTVTVDAGHLLKKDDFVYIPDSSGKYVYNRVVSTTATVITLATAVAVAGNAFFLKHANLGFLWGGNRANGTQSGVSSITIFNSTTYNDIISFNIGDTVRFYDRKTSLYVTRVLTTATLTSIGWDSGTYDTVNVTNLDSITHNSWIEIGRTKDGGNDFYVLARVVPTIGAESTIFQDIFSDDSLIEDFIRPDVDKEWDLPPKAGLIVNHQGVVVYSRIKDEPNTIAYSLPGSFYSGVESVPLASCYFDIPSNVHGPITAIASDVSSLAVFKPNAYYDVQGDFNFGNIGSPDTKAENDFGIASQGCIAKVKGWIVGVGNGGFIRVRNGSFEKAFSAAVQSAVKNQSYLDLTRAQGMNDSINSLYRCYIPGKFGAANSILLVMDYEGDSDSDYEGWEWFNWFYPAQIAPDSSMCVTLFELPLDNRDSSWTENEMNEVYMPCWLCGIGKTQNLGYDLTPPAPAEGVVLRQACSNIEAYNYYDQSEYIDYKIHLTCLHMGNPRIGKIVNDLVLYSLYNEFDIGDFVAWQVRVFGYSGLKNGDSLITDTTKTFSTVTEDFEAVSLGAKKMFGYQIKLESPASIVAPPHLTGLELFFSDPYKKEDVKD